MQNYMGGFLSGAFTMGMLVIVLIIFVDPHERTRMKTVNDAVDHGAAEFYLDDNNERQWRWKVCEDE